LFALSDWFTNFETRKKREMAETGEDCHFFMTSGCTKGAECGFRHSSAAKDNTMVCRHWNQHGCTKLGCTFRHPTRPVTPVAAAPMMGMGMPMMPFGMGAMGAAGGNVCSYFLKGTCKKGASCTFSHAVMDPYQMQMQFLQQQQQLFQQQQQQQQQQQYDGGSGGGSGSGGKSQRRERKERRDEQEPYVPKEKRALTEGEKEALLSKPLQAGTQSKRFKEDKKPAPAVIAVVSQSKPPLPKKPKEVSAAVQIKTLSQIMAEKNKSGNGGASVGASEKKSEKKIAEQDVDEELLAMGLDPKDLEGLAGGDDVDIVM
jgi:hypothetical protein